MRNIPNKLFSELEQSLPFLFDVCYYLKQVVRKGFEMVSVTSKTTQISLAFFSVRFYASDSGVEDFKVPDLINGHILHLYFKHFKMSNSSPSKLSLKEHWIHKHTKGVCDILNSNTTNSSRFLFVLKTQISMSLCSV